VPAPLLIHHHIPKTAGTSMRAVIGAQYDDRRFVELYDADTSAGVEWYRDWWQSLEPKRRDQLRCVGAHSAHFLMPVLDRPFLAFCLLRDPVDRVWSLYRFARWLARRRADGDGGPHHGREIEQRGWSLADIYTELGGAGGPGSELRGHFGPFFNGQARAIVAPWTPKRPAYWNGLPDDAVTLRDEAFGILARNYVVGVQERLALSVDRFADKLRWRETTVPYLNVSPMPHVAPPDERTRALILAHNAVDAELHAHYTAAVERPLRSRSFPRPARPRAQTVCVLGMSRSGTSATTRVLNLLGVYLGPPGDLMAADTRSNPKGFWEHAGIVQVNERLLAAFGQEPTPFGLGWRSPPPLPDGWEADARVAPHRRAARAILRESFAHHRLWGWKDPRTCLTLPFWQRLLPAMRYVVCVRHPLDIAASLEVRDGLTREHALRLWLQSTTAAVLNTSGRPRTFVAFERWFGDWEPNAARLARLVGAEDIPPRQRRAIAAHLDEPLWHHRSAAASDVELGAEAWALHEALDAISDPAAEPSEADHAALDELARRAAAAQV
jgi:sulfotransferase family protein